MDFRDTKAIYLQIADRICDEVLVGKFAEDGRIPSVREYAAVVEVNANTVMRSFDQLQSQGIIYNKRGIGYFVAAGARERILALFKQLYTLGISDAELAAMYRDYAKNQEKNNKL